MKNLKIKTKLFLLVVFMLIGMVALGFMSLSYMKRINEGSTDISDIWLPSVIASEELNTLTSDFRREEYKHIVAQDQQTMQEAETKMEDRSKQIEETFNTYMASLITDETDRQMIQNAQNEWNEYLKNHDTLIALSRENKTDEAMEIVLGTISLYDDVSDLLLDVVEYNKDGADAASLNGDRLFSQAGKVVVIALVVIAALCVLMAIYIIRSISKPVGELDNVAKKIAEGDLDQNITYKSKDEIGTLSVNFNKTVGRLRNYVSYIDEISSVLRQIAGGNLVFDLTLNYEGEFAKVKQALEEISLSLNDTLGQINQAADQVSSGSDQVSSGAQALSQGATEQASSIEELAATINEISTQVKDTAANANAVRQQTDQTGEQVATSNEQMQEMIAAMTEISDKSGQISRIIKTIEDIAFQTNILALNAAVEAARAGEAGKGFAVVADEVRNLASKSSEASKSTAALIEGTVQAVEKGTEIANATAESLFAVVESTKGVVSSVDKIASAADQQAESIAQVTQGIDQISSVVQTNSATAEESAAASEELSSQAQVMKGLVGRFTLRG
ncbi:MAG: methyl-accepting chemotaxis protein [Dorea sp.]|jgi:methyl-accepting chemotaxis protein|nr:methyl-accepting chemotaxis protein [Dorea sp.]MCI9454025.1 methyl-accepting chemotaxis protein [Dorea sp.]